MNDDATSLATFSLMGQGVAFVLGLTLDLALLVIATTVVRKKRPDAAGVLASAAVIMLLATLLAPAMSVLASVITAQQGGPSSVARIHILLGLLVGAVRAVAFGMVLAGIVRLADPGHGGPRG